VLLKAVRNSLGPFSLPNSFGDRSPKLFRTISSILNRKATRQHSPLGGALLYPKDFTLHLDRQASNFIGDSFQINFEYDTRSNRWAVRRKDKRAMLAYVAAAAFALSGLPVSVRPPKRDGGLQQKP
jgi:hypothetical protein